jgi:DNA-directed RNA polymerase subunit RPC12/RpoP
MADFLCTTCGKLFSRKTSFFNHLSAQKQEPCECKECGKLLKNKKQLANHLDSHKTITCIGSEKVIPLNSRGHHDGGESLSVINVPMKLNKTQLDKLIRHTKVHNKKAKEKH